MAPFLSAGETMTDAQYEEWYDRHSIDMTNIEGLEGVKDLSRLEWIREAMGTEDANALRSVPEGFEAYGRVLFPFQSREFTAGDPSSYTYHYRSWAQVAIANEKTPHALMQSASISSDGDGRPESSGPDSKFEEELMAELAHFTSTPTHASFLFWNGYGNINRRTTARLPQMELPLRRECFVLAGDLSHMVRPPLRIQLCVPDDRAWCYGTDTDLDFAYLGCSHACLDALRQNESIEIYQIDPHEQIWHDSDTINS